MSAFLDIIDLPTPTPWAEGETIPWNDPGFSERMLREHLSQAHDAASRRLEVVDRHVDWIHHDVLLERSSSVLDLGCGPGLYAHRLARRGHICRGIDFSPASIVHARAEAATDLSSCTFVEGDIRDVSYGEGHDLVMLVFGELNVFTRTDASRILERAGHALGEGGTVLIEAHTLSAVERVGREGRSWYKSSGGLFSSRPHLQLQEGFWDPERRACTTRYFTIDAETGDVTRHAASMQGYGNDEYRDLFEGAGFKDVERHPSLLGVEDEGAKAMGLEAWIATKR